MEDKYINLTKNVKILNPTFDSDVFKYYGDINKISNFSFEKQKLNYEKIKEKFGKYNIYFNKLWVGKFSNEYNNIYSRFLLKSNCGKVYWRKYSSKNPGSNQNFIYINGIKYKTTYILNLDFSSFENILYIN